jgi:hypothetical protein
MEESGNYVDRCIRYNYVKFFFDNINSEALKNKYCDVFYSSLISRFGEGKLMCADIDSDTPLYIWRNVDYPRNCDSEDPYMASLDMYLAHISIYEHNSEHFIKFCETYCNKNNNLPKRELIKYLKKEVDNHAFNLAKKIFLGIKYTHI